jgi:outer membrane protein assembly factor BamB
LDYAVGAGTVEAFNLADGKRIWKIDKLATSMRNFDGILYMAQREGPDLKEDIGLNPYRKPNDQSPIPSRPKQAIVAVDLKSGNQLWTVPSDSFGAEEYLRIDAAGPGIVAVFQDTGRESFILSGKDGKILSKTAIGHATFFEGGLQLAGQKYDLSTCKVSGKPAFSLGKAFCTPSCYVNGMTISNRGGGGYRSINNKSEKYMGLRGACLLGSIPAYGEMFTAQNWCCCVPSQIQGMIAVGPVSSEPTPDEMERVPVLEKGPEYQAVKNKSAGAGDEEWPMYRKDAERRNSTTTAAPFGLEILWKKTIASSIPDGPVAFNWKENLNSPLTAPVVAGGFVVAAIVDRHQVVALDVSSGKEKWRVTVSGKIDTSPTICEGLCILGCCDGYVYAFNLKNGKLAWRMRAAPREERMVSYGKVESPWPVIGSVLADKGLVYAAAGRSLGSDGGVLLRAIEPSTGNVRWSKALARVEGKQLKLNDIPVKVCDAIQIATLRLDPTTGEFKDNPTEDYLKYIKTKNDLTFKKQDTSALKEPEKKEVAFSVGNDGLISWNWTRLGNRKYQSIKLGNFHGQGVQISWNDKIACALTDLGRGLSVIPRDKIKPAGEPASPGSMLWNARLPEGYQATSVIICGNAIVIGGGIYNAGSSAPKGFIQVYPLDKAQKIAEQVFDSPLAYNGLAMANGNIYAAYDDGSLACIGKKN